MKQIIYRITLQEPTLVTALEGDPNSAVSHDYLPGSVLRGMLIGLTMRQDKIKDLDITEPVVRRRFFEGDTRFLNGYLVINGTRSLPAPQSWNQKKYPEPEKKQEEEDLITDFAFNKEKGNGQTNGKSEDKTKSLGGKFAVYGKDKDGKLGVYVDKPKHVINIHTLRDRTRGRSAGKSNDDNGGGKNEGTIYRYDALEVGQIFEAQILCDTDADADYFCKLLSERTVAVLGGARTAGYGRVKISDVVVKEYAREVGDGNSRVSDILTITLLSDVILRNENGQYAPDAETLLLAIAEKAGLDTTLLDLNKAEFNQNVSVFKKETVVGGFNRKWGLPLPQVQALKMGSVIAISGLTDDVREKLQQLEAQGIGERRAEGFGRIAVGWQQSLTLTKKDEKDNKDTSPPTAPELLGDVKELWERMEKRIKRQTVDRDQQAAANNLFFKNLPPASQLNRLRQKVTTALLQTSPNAEPDTAFIKTFFMDIDGKRAGEHFDKAKVNGKPMKMWLEAKAQETGKYAALRLIDAMLARAVKEKNKTEDKHNERAG